MATEHLQRIASLLDALGRRAAIDAEHEVLLLEGSATAPGMLIRVLEDGQLLWLQVPHLGLPAAMPLTALLHRTYQLPAGGFARDARDGEVVFNLVVPLGGEAPSPALLAQCLALVEHALTGRPAAGAAAAPERLTTALRVVRGHLEHAGIAADMPQEDLLVVAPTGDASADGVALVVPRGDWDLLQWRLPQVGTLAEEDGAEQALLDRAYRLPQVAIGVDAADGEICVTIPQPLAGRAADEAQTLACQQLTAGVLREFQGTRSTPSAAAREVVQAMLSGQALEPVLQRHEAWIGPALLEAVAAVLQPVATSRDAQGAVGAFWSLLGIALAERPQGSRWQNLETAIACHQAALTVRTRDALPADWATTQNNLGIAYADRLAGERRENLETAIACYQAALTVYTREAYPADWARTQMNLGIAYRNRLAGGRRENLETAIACYQAALTVYTRETLPADWARTQNNLGTAYADQLAGERRENLETAIACYAAALTVYTRDAYPADWATTQMNLGNAYLQRLAGGRRENLETAIACYAAALTVYTRDTLPEDWATTQMNLGTAYSDRLAGGRRENLETAIACYAAALTVYTRDTLPEDWATTQMNLGTAYLQRLAGERRENLETAIGCYQAALTVYTRDTLPEDWARTQMNLGNAYRNRLAGERRENLETAIACYQAALTVRTRDAYPADWARTQMNLGIAYRNRLAGGRRENLETAIACYQAALTVYTRDAYPADWATTQNNLGIAYADRLAGGRRENLETAIACYQAALTVYTRDAYPADWATTQNNLGIAYSDRLAGERRENLETAIACYQAALTVYTREALPADWARTQMNLGTAYQQRLAGERRENLETAIACYQAALTVYTREAYPADWATTQNNLGIAYSDRLAGEKRENLETAIACYQAALTVYTREALPADWARTQNNLGIAYRDRLAGEQRENLETAIACYAGALATYTRLAILPEVVRTAANLGHLLFDLQRWEEAAAAYLAAVHTLDTQRQDAHTDAGKEDLAEEGTLVYERLFSCLLQLERFEEAVAILEQSKTRTLLDLLAGRDLRPVNTPPDLVQEYDRLRFALRGLLAQREEGTVGPITEPPESPGTRGAHARGEQRAAEQLALAAKRRRLLDQLEQVIAAIHQHDRDWLPGAPPVDFPSLAEALPTAPASAAILFALHRDATTAIVLRRGADGQPVPLCSADVIPLPDLPLPWLHHQVVKLSNARATNSVGSILKPLLEELPHRLLSPLLPRLHALGLRDLLLVPHRDLHLLPLHAAGPTRDTAHTYPLEAFTIAYAPSLAVLTHTTSQPLPPRPTILSVPVPDPEAKPDADTLRTAEAVSARRIPSQPLLFAALDLEGLAPDLATIVPLTPATAASLHQTSPDPAFPILHAACHGGYDLRNPLQSALSLAEGSTLSLADLYGAGTSADGTPLRYHLAQTLTTLSACEAGISANFTLSDEYQGLPAGMLFAGAGTVVAPLWAVDDLAAALLMRRFYRTLLTPAADGTRPTVAAALGQAQRALRVLTKDEVLADLETEAQRELVRWWWRRSGPDQRPFEHPQFWAPWCAIGASL